MQDFKKLTVYQEAITLANSIYKHATNIQDQRIKDQIIRSSTSIGANIAEFAAYPTRKQQKHKLNICIGESNETEYWLDICKQNKFIREEQHAQLTQQVTTIRRMLCALNNKI